MEEKNTFDKIYNIVAQIPKGSVASYGQVAELAGNRRWARVVGYALHIVPGDANLPCHRVVTKDGKVSGAFVSEGVNRQIMLLEQEGVKCTGGKVDMERYQWKKRVF